jgi:hypothetical protein
MGDRLRQVGNLVEQAFARERGASQHRVDQTADAGFPRLHRLVDCRVIGQAEDQQLAQPDPQDIPRFRIHLAVAQLADPVVEQSPVAQHTEENRLQEPAVGGRKLATLGMALDERVGIVMPFGPGAESGNGGLADVEIFGGHGKRGETRERGVAVAVRVR